MRRQTETVASLEFLKDLPMTRWAWEFLRRNPDYEREFLAHVNGALSRRYANDGTEYLTLSQTEPAAEKWGLSFFTSPNQDAMTAPVFWTEEASPHVVCVHVTPNETGVGNAIFKAIFEKNFLGIRRIHFTDAEGREQLLLQQGKRIVQLRCRGLSLLAGDVDFSFVLDGFGDIDAKIETIRRLKRFYDAYTKTQKSGTDWTPRILQLRDALIALDVAQADGSHYEAAVKIYGETRAAEEFQGEDSPLKSRMKRLRKKGVDLMEGGYLDLMK